MMKTKAMIKRPLILKELAFLKCVSSQQVKLKANKNNLKYELLFWNAT